MITQRINLNLIPGGVLPRINVSQYDTGSRTLELVLYNGDTAFNVPAGANVQIVGTKLDNTGFEYSCTYTDNVVSVDITDQMTVFGGEVVTELRILKDDDQLGTGNFIINVEPTALKDDVVISETDIPIIQQLPSLIAQAESSAELAHQWADYGDESDTPSATNNAKYWSIQAAAAAAGCLRPAIVPSLPTSDISTVTLYFVPSSDPDTGNLYDEYINTDGTSAGWELIGSTGVDLSAYLQKTGDSKDNTVTYTSDDDDTVFNTGNLGGQSAYAWTAANSLASGEKHSVLFNKISAMLKNLRTIAKLIGTADISTIGTSPNTGTVTGAISKINSDLSELYKFETHTFTTSADALTFWNDLSIVQRSLSRITEVTVNLVGYTNTYTRAQTGAASWSRTANTPSTSTISDRTYVNTYCGTTPVFAFEANSMSAGASGNLTSNINLSTFKWDQLQYAYNSTGVSQTIQTDSEITSVKLVVPVLVR